MNYQYLHSDFDLSFNQLGLSGPEAASLLSYQPPLSYVSPVSHDPDMSGLLTTSLDAEKFPSSPVFPGLQENAPAKSERRSLGNRKPRTPSPALRSRRRVSHVAAQQHSPSPSSPSYAPSPYLTSPADSAALISPRLSLYAPIAAPRDDAMVIAPAAEDEDDAFLVSQSKKRRKPPPPASSSSSGESSPPDGERLTAADELLVRLREDENLPWKDVAARFRAETGRDFSVAALQMRLKRLRERVRPWTDRDVLALRMAHDYWISHKFEIIAAKVSSLSLDRVSRSDVELDDGLWFDGGLVWEAVREEVAPDGLSNLAHPGEGNQCHDLTEHLAFPFVFNWPGGVIGYDLDLVAFWLILKCICYSLSITFLGQLDDE
jgi:hypothetical protein